MKERILADRPNSKNFVRLYALGIDSFSIATRLQQLKAMTGKSVQAQTGAISIDQQGVIQRQLQLAEIRNGVVIAADIDQQ
jgi:outer membrane PBP1 activator LpoA protein